MDIKFNRVNLETVANSKDCSSIITNLANKLMDNPYYSISTFYKTMGMSDLEAINMWIENLHDEEAQSTNDFVLLTLMLLYAEGLDVATVEELHKVVQMMAIIVSGVSLERKGLVKIYWENMTLSIDSEEQEKPLFERIL